MIGSSSNTEIYGKTGSETYQLLQNISESSYGTTKAIFVSSDEKYLIRGFSNGKVVIYMKQSIYQFFQEIHDSVLAIDSASVTGDLKRLAAGGDDNQVRIYEEQNGQFQFSQTIVAGFPVYFIKLTKDNLLMSGSSSQLLFYKNDGQQYELDEIVNTGGSLFKRVPISDDFQTLAFGVNLVLKIYEKKSNY